MNSPGFNDKFAALARQEDAGTVFDDLLTYIISLFSFECPWESHGHYRMPDVRSRFFELFREIVLLMQSRLQNAGDWYDPFGLFYETYVSSQSRKTCSGQFFTPPHVVDLMVRMQGGREELVAEFSAALAGYGLGVFSSLREENAAYLKGWLEQIREDPKFLFSVLTDVQHAVRYIGRQLGVPLLCDAPKEDSAE